MTMVTNSKQGIPEPGLEAAREGRTICHYVNEKTGLDSQTVLTDSTLTLNMETGRRYIITCFYFHLGTDSDTMEAEIGVTDQPDGAGEFTAKSPLFQIETSDKKGGADPSLVYLTPPFCFSVDDGVCITVRATANDSAAELTFGYNGWWEDDI